MHETKQFKERNIAIDFIKGIAIIAVALYHFGGGLLPYGYLGVDIFLVVGGYLLFRSLIKGIESGKFSYWNYLLDKAVRLWPLVLISIAVSLLLGYFLMLPDDYENLSESAVASSFFQNNVLQCITTKNYWNAINLYKPLMHLWYVGVLTQAYFIIPLILFILKKLMRNSRKGYFWGILTLTMISVALYLVPVFTTAWKFYYLPFRLFELTAGGCLVFLKDRKIGGEKFCKISTAISFIVIIFLLCVRDVLVSGSLMLLMMVIATLTFLLFTSQIHLNSNVLSKVVSCVARIGLSSYSIYIWHQVIVAFLFYSLFQYHDTVSFAIFAFLTIMFSIVSYKVCEAPLSKAAHDKHIRSIIVVSCVALSVLISGLSFLIYKNAGVMRDVPELGISTKNVRRNMHAEYCDRPYAWNRSFENDGQTHILVIGNSFGRDWANILYEWNASLDISYAYYQKEDLNKYIDRIEMADLVFYVMGPDYEAIPTEVLDLVASEKLYVVGNKNFGESNGIIYARRNTDKYFAQTIELPNALITQNEKCKLDYGSHYIDMLDAVRVTDKTVRVFTDSNMFISQDCKHLTQAGAIYYAERINLESIIQK